jgi:hypothetical protein
MLLAPQLSRVIRATRVVQNWHLVSFTIYRRNLRRWVAYARRIAFSGKSPTSNCASQSSIRSYFVWSRFFSLIRIQYHIFVISTSIPSDTYIAFRTGRRVTWNLWRTGNAVWRPINDKRTIIACQCRYCNCENTNGCDTVRFFHTFVMFFAFWIDCETKSKLGLLRIRPAIISKKALD